MSAFDAAPPNTHVVGNVDTLSAQDSPPLAIVANNDADNDFDMEQYKKEVPKWKRFYQHSLTQMMLLSVQAFCGPAMADAIAGLGGGGLATPQTSNIA
jgi:hypothetical protein